MHEQSIGELLKGLERRELSSEELTRHYLERIAKLDPQLNSFITITGEEALTRARESDARRASGEARALEGIPIAHKDIFCTKGITTTCASKMLANFTAPYDATVVSRLDDAGAILLGKTNMDEFAMGSSSETGHFGDVGNPWDPSRVAGGSSGGSAAAVAARLSPAATGTDTGGSIRQPASFCGVTGLKPTYGRISRWGMIAYASSLDQAGTLTASAEDAALLLSAMAGFDPRDSTSIDAPVPHYAESLNRPVDGVRIGLVRQYFGGGLDARVEATVHDAVAALEGLGATIVEVDLPHLDYAIPAYYVIAPAECSANLARYDGVRFGYRCEDPTDIEDLYRRSRSEGFGREVKRRILAGTFALSAGYYDAYYRKAQQVRRLIRDDFAAAFGEADLIVGPTAPTTAFGRGEKTERQIDMYLQDIYTIACNLAGLPAASVPAGFVDDLPVGIQLIGNYLDEERILRIAHQYQQVTDWHRRLPPAATAA